MALYSWIGHLVRTQKKNAARPRELRQIQNYVQKALVEVHPLVRGKNHFFWRVILKKIDEKCPKFFRAPHSLMRLVEISNADVSGVSEVPQTRGKLFFWEVQLLCFCSKIDLARQNWSRSRSIEILKYKR